MKKIYTGLLLLSVSFVAKAQFPAPYCAEAFSSSVEPITNVTFAGINNTSSATIGGMAHENYTSITGTVQQGNTYTISVKGNTDGDFQDGVAVYFDFNNNGVFTDAGEGFGVGVLANSTGTDAVVATAPITIPPTAPIGNIRMRVIKKFFAYSAPCNTGGYGQAEDYTINITASACAFPTNLRFGNVTIPNATIAWNAATGVSSYQYAVTTSSTPPASGTVTTSTTATVGSLPANTTLYAYVRSVCSANTYTAWISRTYVPNDSCGTPRMLTGNTTISGSTLGATQSLPGVLCDGSTISYALDVWYSFVADFNGTAVITLTPVSADYDGVLVGYRGNCESLTNIGCADIGLDGDPEVMTLTNLTAGQTYRVRVYDWNGGGNFTIRVTGSALPVTGVNLTAARNGKNVQLGWQTLTEMNNVGFELQRSADGNNFTSFLKVASKANGGNSSSAINYTADDIKPFSGAAYYRLKQTDKDSKVNYSNIAFVRGMPVSNLTLSAIYPNPTKDVLKAAIQSPAAEKLTFIISDMTGKVISRQVTSVSSGDNTVNLNVTSLPSGNYLLKATCSNGCETAVQKFTKQ